MAAVRRLIAVLVLAVALAALSAALAGAQSMPARCTAFAVLKPGNEVPPTNSRATGAALVHINGTRLTSTVAIANPARETFILGHIHRGPAGMNGPIIVPLFEGPASSSRLFTPFESIQITAENAAAICGNLAGHYVNYHTTANTGGAIRGQLRRLF